MEISVRRVGVWRKGRLSVGLFLLALSLLALLYNLKFLTPFFAVIGVELVTNAYKKNALKILIDGTEFKVIVRGGAFDVSLLKDGALIWRGKVMDYFEVDGFSFDVVDGKLVVGFGGKELGRLGR